MHLVIQILCGISGSNALAAMFRHRCPGLAGKSAIGVIGGLLGAPALDAVLGVVLGAGDDAVDLVQTAAGSGAGGAALMGAAVLVRSLARR